MALTPGTKCTCGCGCAIPKTPPAAGCPCKKCGGCKVCGSKGSPISTESVRRTPPRTGGTMTSPNAAPVTEAQFQQLLAVATAIGARTAQAAPAAPPTPAPTAEQAAVTEAEQLRAMDSQQLGQQLLHRLTEAYGMNSPGWLAETRARGGRTILDPPLTEATAANSVTEAALAALNDPRALAESSTGELARQIRLRMNAAHGLRSPGWR